MPAVNHTSETCLVLPNTCASNEWVVRAGTATQNITCSACSSCEAGKYRAGGCNGVLDVQCAPCTTACSQGEYLDGNCPLGAAADNVCRACDGTCGTCSGAGSSACRTCAEGLYLTSLGTCVSRCPSGQFEARLNETEGQTLVCQPCSPSCGGLCSGPNPNQCITCPVGQYIWQGSCAPTCAARGPLFRDPNHPDRCVLCSTCSAASEYQGAACNESSDTVCLPQSRCLQQQYEAAAPTPTSDRQCVTCSTCPPGTGVVSRCSASANTVCTPCVAGANFSDTDSDVGACRPTRVCTIGSAQRLAPTASSDRECRLCDGVTEFQNQEGQLSCLPVTQCPPGQQEILSPTRVANRLCVACPAESFKPASGPEPCTPATKCAAFQVMND